MRVHRQGLDQGRLIPHCLFIKRSPGSFCIAILAIQFIDRIDRLERILLNAQVDANDIVVAATVHLGDVPEQSQINVVASVDGEEVSTLDCRRDGGELGGQRGLTPAESRGARKVSEHG